MVCFSHRPMVVVLPESVRGVQLAQILRPVKRGWGKLFVHHQLDSVSMLETGLSLVSGQ